ncbi:DUF397 domain-containing protein (plasmid) [Saccharopolyspora sp. ID03-671]|uniref:DUF397 domain-containing protein n=1 Tax=Saccharopolyspora sp. ID03-671 TaxID=3073066 RepID=UPI0030F4176A
MMNNELGELALEGLAWRTSSYSQNNAACVDVAFDDGTVYVRDTKDHGTGPVIRFSHTEWQAFLDIVTGASDTPHDIVEIVNDQRLTTHANGRTETTAWHLEERTDGRELHYTRGEWDAFVLGAATGEFSVSSTESATV